MSTAKFGECQEREDAVKEISYRQKEHYNLLRYLSDRERKTAEELNAEVASYNQAPSAAALQRAEDLKVKIIENLQDQIKNDRDYIAYLELRLSVKESAGEVEEAAEGSTEAVAPLKFEGEVKQ